MKMWLEKNKFSSEHSSERMTKIASTFTKLLQEITSNEMSEEKDQDSSCTTTNLIYQAYLITAENASEFLLL